MTPHESIVANPQDVGVELSAVEGAVTAVAFGLPVFPLNGINADGSCRCGHEHPASDIGKHPCWAMSTVSAVADTKQIGEWVTRDPKLNFGIATGREIGKSGMMPVVISANKNNWSASDILDKAKGLFGPHVEMMAVVDAEPGVEHTYLALRCADDYRQMQGGGLKAYGPGEWVLCAGSQYTVGCTYQFKFLAEVDERAPTESTLPTDSVEAVAAEHGEFSDAEVEPSEEVSVVFETESLESVRLVEREIAPEVEATLDATVDQDAAAAPEKSAVTVVNATVQAFHRRVMEVREIAADYDACGFKLCAVAPGSKGPRYKDWPTKPVAPHDFGDSGIGLIHALSGTCAIDLDDLVGAEAYLSAHGIELRELLHDDDAVQIRSGRPNRAKLLYRVPEGVSPLQTVKVKGSNQQMVIEFRCASSDGSGIQDVLPPTIHPDTGAPYEWAGAGDFHNLTFIPEKLLSHWRGLETNPEKTQGAGVSQMAGAVAEGGRNEHLYKVAGDMAALGVGEAAVSAALQQINLQQCKPALSPFEVEQIARNAMRYSRGAQGKAEEEELAKIASQINSETAVLEHLSAASVGETLNGFPQLMRSIAGWYEVTGRTIQPAFSVAAALSACGAVLARDFTGAAGAYSNLYCVAIGPTACGKENALDVVSRVVERYDSGRLAGLPASDVGVLSAMARNPATMFVIDEIGEILKGIFDNRAANHKAMIGTTFMELYTKGGRAYRGREYSDHGLAGGRPRVDIFSPCPSIFGATTATTFYDGINHSVINSGFLPRIMVFRAPDAVPMPNLKYEQMAMPEDVEEWLTALQERRKQHQEVLRARGNLKLTLGEGHYPIEVPYSIEAKEIFNAEQIKIVERRNGDVDPLESNMLSRVVENAGRVALILALAADPWAKEVSADWLQLALRIVNKASADFMRDISANLFDSKYSELEGKAFEFIKKLFLKEGKPVTEKTLADRCKKYGGAAPRDRKAAIRALTEQGKITVGEGRNTGTIIYTPTVSSLK